jgi:hypothetical protein
MKTQTKRRVCQFQLKIISYGNSYYIERITKLERTLARKPRTLRIEMIGEGEIPADTALLIRSVLMKRSPNTRLITEARSSLQGGSVLVWLLGDERIIRDDARVISVASTSKRSNKTTLPTRKSPSTATPSPRLIQTTATTRACCR